MGSRAEDLGLLQVGEPQALRASSRETTEAGQATGEGDDLGFRV